MNSRVWMMVCVVLCTSTTGDVACTSTDSPTEPTGMSALTGTVTSAGTLMPSCRVLLNPGALNVTEYVPGRIDTMAYLPSPLVVTVRDCSMSAGLEACTFTPGITAPLG